MKKEGIGSLCPMVSPQLFADDSTHLFPMHPFSIPENIGKPDGFLMFSGVTERVHWERMS